MPKPILIDDGCITVGLNLPLDPWDVAALIKFAGPRGQFESPIVRQTLPAADGATAVLNIPVMPGYVGIVVSPLYLSSTYYDTGITVTVLADNEQVTPLTVPMTEALELHVPKHTVLRSGITLQVANASGFNAMVSATLEIMYLQKSYYDDFFAPLMRAGYRTLSRYAEIVRKDEDMY